MESDESAVATKLLEGLRELKNLEDAFGRCAPEELKNKAEEIKNKDANDLGTSIKECLSKLKNGIDAEQEAAKQLKLKTLKNATAELEKVVIEFAEKNFNKKKLNLTDVFEKLNEDLKNVTKQVFDRKNLSDIVDNANQNIAETLGGSYDELLKNLKDYEKKKLCNEKKERSDFSGETVFGVKPSNKNSQNLNNSLSSNKTEVPPLINNVECKLISEARDLLEKQQEKSKRAKQAVDSIKDLVKDVEKKLKNNAIKLVENKEVDKFMKGKFDSEIKIAMKTLFEKLKPLLHKEPDMAKNLQNEILV